MAPPADCETVPAAKHRPARVMHRLNLPSTRAATVVEIKPRARWDRSAARQNRSLDNPHTNRSKLTPPALMPAPRSSNAPFCAFGGLWRQFRPGERSTVPTLSSYRRVVNVGQNLFDQH